MDVKVLTTDGCTNCVVLEEMLDKLGIKYEVINITKHPEILQKYQVMMAPGLVVDGELKSTGIPKIDELKGYLGI